MTRSPPRLPLLLGIALGACAPALGAQAVPTPELPLSLTRLGGPIVLDGVLDEDAWADLPLLPVTMYGPVFQGDPTQRTEIRIGYDDTYLYVAGWMFDSDPGGVRSTTLTRDQYSGDDLFSVVLDTYNDYESALWFTASPSGVRSDRSVSNDGQFTNGSAMNNDWNSFWDLATTWTEDGWFAEMRIPFSSLGFQDEDGQVVMGLIVYRFIARNNERLTWPAIPPNWGLGFAKPSQAQRVSLQGVYAENPMYIRPYVLGGMEQASRLNQTETGFETSNDPMGEAGLDVKYNVSDNLTLDLTFNPDFGQVEADSLQVNLTRFSLFFPEKRQFFQERSGLFGFNTGGFSRLFHSRRIGLDAVGNPVRILGGARLVGRMGATDVGFLNMQTASHDGRPSENFGVVRLRRQIFNPFSTVGGMLTTRIDTEGGYGVTGGFDTSVRVVGDEYVTLKWAGTFNDRPDELGDPTLLDLSRFVARWERRNQTGLSYLADYVRSGSGYEPRMGFVVRRNYSQLGGNVQYRWFQSAESALRTITLGTRGAVYTRGTVGGTESALIVPSLAFELKNGRRINLDVRTQYESVLDGFLLSGVTPIEPGEYWFTEGSARLTLSRSSLLRGGLTVGGGTFFDGWRAGFGGGPTLSVNRHFEIGAGYEFNAVRFPDRDEELNAHLFSFKTQLALDTHLSGSLLVQYNSTVEGVVANARIRYHFGEGNDLWLVYNDAVNTQREVIGLPRLPFSNQRALMLKYTYTFIR